MKLFWDITNKCNLKCQYCCANDLVGINNNIDTSSWKNILNKCDKSIDSVILLGGEPLLHPQILDILHELNNRNIDVNIITNGQSDKSMVEAIFKYNIHTLEISIEGMEKCNDAIRGKGSWQKAIKFIDNSLYAKNMYNKKTEILVNMVVNKINHKDIINFIDHTKEKGISYQISGLMIKGKAVINQNDLIMSEASELDFYEELAKYMIKNSEIKVNFPDLPPLVIDYLNRKFNLSLPIETNKCNAGTSTMYSDLFGNLHPCKEYNLPDNKSNSWNHIYSSFGEFLERRDNNKNQRACDCKFKDKCNCCPITEIHDMRKICSVAIERFKSLTLNCDSRFVLIPPYAKARKELGTKYYFPNQKITLYFDKIGSKIMDNLDKEKNIDELSLSTGIEKNILNEFLYEQKLKGIVIEKRSSI